MHFRGFLPDGTEFAASDWEDAPHDFVLGEGEILDDHKIYCIVQSCWLFASSTYACTLVLSQCLP